MLIAQPWCLVYDGEPQPIYLGQARDNDSASAHIFSNFEKGRGRVENKYMNYI